MNKINTKYSNIEFQHKRFRLLNGEIISKMSLWKIYSYIYPLRKFRNNQEELWYHMLYLFILESSRDYSMIPVNSRNFYLHGKENSSEFWTFLQGSRTLNDNAFLISRWLVILLEKSYNQINTLLTSKNIWVNRN